MKTKELLEYNRKRNFDKTGEPEGKLEKPGNPENFEGKLEKARERLRFVVQHHLARRDHYDFRLEWDGALLSWAVPKGPSYNTRDKRLAIQVEDHPLEYRNFEGTIPKGEYGGGVVMLWDEGCWEPQLDVNEGLRKGMLKFVLKGRRLKGKWALIRTKGKTNEAIRKANEAKNEWLFLKEKDDYAKSSDGISGFTTSVRTGRTMKEIEEGKDAKVNTAKNPFDRINVQLAKLVNTAPEGEDWLYEVKYDGYRIVAYIEGENVRLITRNGNDYTRKFQNIANSLTDWAAGRPMILDGEMVITDKEGKPDFQALQNYIRSPGGKSLTYVVFDLLALDGADLRGYRLTDRKEMLEELLKDSPGNIHYSRHIIGNGKASFLAACESGLEGIVGKKADSVYSGTRNGDWIKLKCDTRQEFVIGGYVLTDKKTSGISSLLLGVYEGSELIYAGRAGTGLTERSMKELEKKFEGKKREETPFKVPPKPKKNERITWLEPELVAEVKFAEWTSENLLRQASFKGLRTDKAPGEIQREKEMPANEKEVNIKVDKEMTENDKPMNTAIGITEKEVPGKAQEPVKEQERDKLQEPEVQETGKESESPSKIGGNYIINGNYVIDGKNVVIEGTKISNPDKVIFKAPEIKKADIALYYVKVSERMLPYVGNRILSIVRCPKGISGSCFYKKHPGPGSKGIVTVPVTNSYGENEEYFYITDAAGLVAEVQMGTLEFHTWGSRADNMEKPDMMVFDLDPDEGMDLEKVRQGVKDLKSLLDQLSLVSFLKTSGGKGYHVVVPFQPTAGWDTFYDFSRRIAVVMEQKWPDRYTSNIRKDRRKNRIFIDWIRNGRGATSIAPYSIRARNGALVSMPIEWKELDIVAPDGVNMIDALMRLQGSDPWKDFYQINQRLK